MWLYQNSLPPKFVRVGEDTTSIQRAAGACRRRKKAYRCGKLAPAVAAVDNQDETGKFSAGWRDRGANRQSGFVMPIIKLGESMKLRMLLVVSLAAGTLGCAEKEQAAPDPGKEMEEGAAAVTEAVTVEPEAAAPQAEDWRNSALLDHMHAHAEQLDDLNFSLADGDLEGAMTPAYWLSRHKTVTGLPAELQPFVDGMREAALSVEGAEDLETARAGAEKIAAQCQACHAAVGVSPE